MNIEQSKHVANSARMVGAAQFAAIGYKTWGAQATDWRIFGVSAVLYLIAELLAYKVLGTAK